MEILTLHPGEDVRVRVARFDPERECPRGLPVVIVPGWGGEIDQFADLARAVARYAPAYIYEPHGFGRSSAPHRPGLYGSRAYNREMQRVFGDLGFAGGEFVILGSCSGASMAFSYATSGLEPQPRVIAAISPVLRYRTPQWMVVFNLIPPRIMEAVQRLILKLLGLYLRRRSPLELKSIHYIAGQLRRSDEWAQRRFLVDFIRRYDLTHEVGRIEVPVIGFVGERDWFTEPSGGGAFLHHPDSRVHVLPARGHRIQAGNEEALAEILDRDVRSICSRPPGGLRRPEGSRALAPGRGPGFGFSR